MQSLYLSGSANVSYSGKKSYQFNLSQGVRQGSILSPHLYNIYTEDLLSSMHSDLKIGASIFGIYTGIVAYADDLILISSSLSSLQKMVNHCVSYGIENKIKFNAGKTEFIISGIQHLDSTTTYIKLDGQRIKPSYSLKHLGFKWSSTSASCIASLQQSHIYDRVGELWATTDALIRSGIRFCHPYTIAKLFNTIVVPRLIYGIEICELTQPVLDKINIQARSALKSLFNLSKFSRNLLHPALHLSEVSDILLRNKLKLFMRLLQNKTTRDVILTELVDGNYISSFIADIQRICSQLHIDFSTVLVTKRFVIQRNQEQAGGEEIDRINVLRIIFEHWRLPEKRKEFVELMEQRVPTNSFI